MGFTKWLCPHLTYLNVNMEEKLKLIERLTFYFHEQLNENNFHKDITAIDNVKDSNETQHRQMFYQQFQISSEIYKKTKLCTDLILSLKDKPTDNIKIKI